MTTQTDHIDAKDGTYYTLDAAARALGLPYYKLVDMLRRRSDIPRVLLGNRLTLVKLADVQMGLMRQAVHFGPLPA